jgi:hypothetical protein
MSASSRRVRIGGLAQGMGEQLCPTQSQKMNRYVIYNSFIVLTTLPAPHDLGAVLLSHTPNDSA